ncbi:unnamed protein product [Notodromas monacha]|uniref:Uncharacterized protein n=1 Tax=Notodromas monacha TaxID=399045 RepID=A0A7R9BWW2_9CRUS|nr:unnamed protein product [Notodromas monacha]CAG0921607.1 unnamed protein product [Notodromas monacha]
MEVSTQTEKPLRKCDHCGRKPRTGKDPKINIQLNASLNDVLNALTNLESKEKRGQLAMSSLQKPFLQQALHFQHQLADAELMKTTQPRFALPPVFRSQKPANAKTRKKSANKRQSFISKSNAAADGSVPGIYSLKGLSQQQAIFEKDFLLRGIYQKYSQRIPAGDFGKSSNCKESSASPSAADDENDQQKRKDSKLSYRDSGSSTESYTMSSTAITAHADVPDAQNGSVARSPKSSCKQRCFKCPSTQVVITLTQPSSPHRRSSSGKEQKVFGSPSDDFHQKSSSKRGSSLLQSSLPKGSSHVMAEAFKQIGTENMAAPEPGSQLGVAAGDLNPRPDLIAAFDEEERKIEEKPGKKSTKRSKRRRSTSTKKSNRKLSRKRQQRPKYRLTHIYDQLNNSSAPIRHDMDIVSLIKAITEEKDRAKYQQNTAFIQSLWHNILQIHPGPPAQGLKKV